MYSLTFLAYSNESFCSSSDGMYIGSCKAGQTLLGQDCSACKQHRYTLVYSSVGLSSSVPTSYAVTECVLHSTRNICHLMSMLSQAGETRPCRVTEKKCFKLAPVQLVLQQDPSYDFCIHLQRPYLLSNRANPLLCMLCHDRDVDCVSMTVLVCKQWHASYLAVSYKNWLNWCTGKKSPTLEW